MWYQVGTPFCGPGQLFVELRHIGLDGLMITASICLQVDSCRFGVLENAICVRIMVFLNCGALSFTILTNSRTTFSNASPFTN